MIKLSIKNLLELLNHHILVAHKATKVELFDSFVSFLKIWSQISRYSAGKGNSTQPLTDSESQNLRTILYMTESVISLVAAPLSLNITQNISKIISVW